VVGDFKALGLGDLVLALPPDGGLLARVRLADDPG
jgi:hypothetical protein